MTEAFETYEHAANHSPASAKIRFDAAVIWAREAHRRGHQSAVHAYIQSLTLLGPRLILTHNIESQQKLLASVPKALAADAASCSINRGEYKFAIELLEQGRVILWSILRGYRHSLDKLRIIDKELTAQFETLSGQLEGHAMSVESDLPVSFELNEEQPIGYSFEEKAQQHRILSGKWDDVVDKSGRLMVSQIFYRLYHFLPFKQLLPRDRLSLSILANTVLTPLSFKMLAILSSFPYLKPYLKFLKSCLSSLQWPAPHMARILQD